MAGIPVGGGHSVQSVEKCHELQIKMGTEVINVRLVFNLLRSS